MKFNLYPEISTLALDDVFLVYQDSSGAVKTISTANIATAIAVITQNVAALQAIPVASVATGFTANTLGYNTRGDGGGADFYYDSGSVLTADGGSVIAPNAGSGRWIRIPTTEIDLRSFGADSTGLLDCRNQLQRALNYCRSIGATLVSSLSEGFRVASTKPIYVGKVSMRNLRIFNSIPDDYSWTVYGVDGLTYSTTGVVDSTGALVSWASDPSLPGGRPWNGKTNMFESVTQATIENCYFDGGWWTTPPSNLPASFPTAKSIRGVKGLTTDESTYYQVFAGTLDSTFIGCKFYNSPGAVIETGERIRVLGCYWTDYGDHCIYLSNADGLSVEGGQIVATRSASGSAGQRDYIYATWRDAFKLRATRNASCDGVIAEFTGGATDRCLFNLETNSATGLGGDSENIQVSNCHVNGGELFLFQSYRSAGGVPYGGDGIGYYHKNILFSDCTVTSAGPYFGNFYQAACDGVTIRGCTFRSSSTGQILTMPSPEYVNAFRDVRFENCDFFVTGGAIFVSAGPFWGAGRLVFTECRYHAPTLNSSNALLVFQDPVFGCTCEFEFVHFLGCGGENLYSLWTIGGDELDWLNTTNYYGFERTYPDATINRGTVVISGGSYYRCRSDITGGAGPGVDNTHWASYTRQTVRELIVNTRSVVESATGLLTYWLRQRLGFLAAPYAADNRIQNIDGTLQQYLLKAGTCLDTVTNLCTEFYMPFVTPASDTDAWPRGKMSHDADYIYVAYAASQIGRVTIDKTPF